MKERHLGYPRCFGLHDSPFHSILYFHHTLFIKYKLILVLLVPSPFDFKVSASNFLLFFFKADKENSWMCS